MTGHAPREAQQQSLQSSLLFMQQEHANTLKCLHQEISRLQKKCQDLTFQLAMNTTSTVDEEKYRKQIKSLEGEVQEKSKRCCSLTESGDKKDKKIKTLEQQLHSQEKQRQDELKTHGQALLTLRHELDTKSNKVAYLTTQLHQMKVREANSSERRPSLEGRITLSDRDSVSPISPVPPPLKESAAPRIHRRYKPSKTVPNMENGMYSMPIAPPSRGMGGAGRRLPVRPDSQESLDPAVFLHLHVQEPGVDIKPVPVAAVLPPISSGGADNPPRPFLKRQVTMPQADLGHAASTIEVELESLAIDQVTGKDGKLRRTQEYHGLDG